jgi:hypothetical protein
MNATFMNLKAIEWAKAKGALRTFADLLGSAQSSYVPFPDDSSELSQWEQFTDKSEKFIQEIEDEALQE